MKPSYLNCDSCDRTYDLVEPVWGCACGGLLDIVSEPSFDRRAIARRPPTLWRYREAIAVLGDPVTFQEGMTPLVRSPDQGAEVFWKLDHLFPTGSFKDRGATALVTHARALGIPQVVEDSSGNAGAAIAAYCALAGIGCDIYAPEHASPGKLVQITATGASLHPIRGSREDVAKAAFKASGSAYYASHCRNPFFFQGTKTVAYEICEQLDWKSPDALICPAGNGTLLLGLYQGFSDLKSANIIDRLPRLIAGQAAGCAPLAEAFHAGLDEAAKIKKGDTIAEGIAVAEPVRGGQMLRAIRKTGGRVFSISDEETIEALRRGVKRGIFIEPTAAVSLATAGRYLEENQGGLSVVILTGSGLKAAEVVGGLISG